MSADTDVAKTRHVHAPAGIWECSFGDFGATQTAVLCDWQGMNLPDPAALHVLR